MYVNSPSSYYSFVHRMLLLLLVDGFQGNSYTLHFWCYQTREMKGSLCCSRFCKTNQAFVYVLAKECDANIVSHSPAQTLFLCQLRCRMHHSLPISICAFFFMPGGMQPNIRIGMKFSALNLS